MKMSLALGSLVLFGLSVVLLFIFTLAESALLGVSPQAERIISLLGLVLPALIGMILGILSIMRGDGRRGLAATGVVLNTLFALFHLAVILFAG